MKSTIGELIKKDIYSEVLDSIMPGGRNWKSRDIYCLDSCPFQGRCIGSGPAYKLCTSNWRNAPAKAVAFMVLKHVFQNFDHYNANDVSKIGHAQAISEIEHLLDFEFDESMSAASAKAVVEVRLLQAVFKANLFKTWGGCSLNLEFDPKFLIASHIVPWASSEGHEKTSQFNGLLLPANYDYLFDRNLISFDERGRLMISNRPSVQQACNVLGVDHSITLKSIDGNLWRQVDAFLESHRKVFLQKESA